MRESGIETHRRCDRADGWRRLKRGDVVIAVMAGDYGKPRPAVVVQSDALVDLDFSSVVVCPVSSFTSGGSKVRVAVAPDRENGLLMASEVMVEKLTGLPKQKLRRVIGRLDSATMHRIDRALMVVLGLGRTRS